MPAPVDVQVELSRVIVPFPVALSPTVSDCRDVLFASPFLGNYPIFGRTASGYPRGEAYWGRLGEIAGATDVMMAVPDPKAARMSDHFDLTRDKDRMMFEEFMEPEGWASAQTQCGRTSDPCSANSASPAAPASHRCIPS